MAGFSMPGGPLGYDALMDYGYVVGTFIHPLGAPAPTDRGITGTVKFIPFDERKLATPPRTAARVTETLSMDVAGHIQGWLVTGYYQVSITWADGSKRTPFPIHVEDVHTVANPLDLTLAAPPVVTPTTVVVVSEDERIRAEAAADRAEAAADEVEPVHIYSDVDLQAVTKPGPAILHIPAGAVFSPAIPANSLLTQAANYPIALAGEVSIFDYTAIIPGVKLVTLTVTMTPDQFSAQVNTLSVYQNYPAAPSYWTVSDFTPIPQSGGTIIRSVSIGGGKFRWIEAAPQSAPINDTIMVRDAFGRSQVASPTLTADIANKAYVDGRVPTITPAASASGPYYDIVGHAPGVAAGTAWSVVQGSPTSLANFIVIRDAAGRAQMATPSAAADIATKGYVDGRFVALTSLDAMKTVTASGPAVFTFPAAPGSMTPPVPTDAATAVANVPLAGNLTVQTVGSTRVYTLALPVSTAAKPGMLVGTGVYNTTSLVWTTALAWQYQVQGLQVAVPATATSPGQPGQFAVAPNFLYVCIAANSWQRVALVTW